MLRTILVALVAAQLAACDSNLLAPTPTDISVEVLLSNDTLADGDTITIDVVITNLTKDEILWSGSACPLNVELNGGAVPQPARLTALACIALYVPHILGPGEQETFTFPFDGMAWQAPSPLGPETWVELSPGTYEVLAEILGPKDWSSEPVTLEILP